MGEAEDVVAALPAVGCNYFTAFFMLRHRLAGSGLATLESEREGGCLTFSFIAQSFAIIFYLLAALLLLPPLLLRNVDSLLPGCLQLSRQRSSGWLPVFPACLPSSLFYCLK